VIPGENSGIVDEGRTQPKKKDIARALRKKPPAIIVRVNDGSYSEALKKLKLNEQVKAISDGIVGLTKTRDGDLLIRLNPRTESLQLVEAIGTAMGDRSVVKELVRGYSCPRPRRTGRARGDQRCHLQTNRHGNREGQSSLDQVNVQRTKMGYPVTPSGSSKQRNICREIEGWIRQLPSTPLGGPRYGQVLQVSLAWPFGWSMQRTG